MTLHQSPAEFSWIHVAGIHHILFSSRLSNHNLLGGDSDLDQFLNRSVQIHKQRGIGVIFHMGALVIELDVVEIDEISHFLVHSHISSLWIVSFIKVGRLGSMGNNVIRQPFA